MALLGLLLGLRHLHGWRLQLWHGDHGWRSDSAQQADELAAWCSAHDLPLQLDRWDHPQAGESAARQWRYRSLERCALALGCCRVVSGHTASDRAETLLLHLARGSHRRGLGSLRALRPLNDSGASALQLSRPLLIFCRNETARICHQLELPVWLDSSNNDQRYSRNRIRREVLPVLEQLHPGATRRLSGTAERLQQEHDCASEWVEVALEWMQGSTGATRTDAPIRQLPRQRLLRLQRANQRAVLELWLRHNGTSLGDAAQSATLLARLQQGQPPGRIDLSGGWHLHWNRSTLELIAPFPSVP